MKPHVVLVPVASAQTATKAALDVISAADKLFLQTRLHPAARVVTDTGKPFTAMDDLYESCADFDALNDAIASRLLAAGESVYVVTGDVRNSQIPVIERAFYAAGGCVSALAYVPQEVAAFPDRRADACFAAADLPQTLDIGLSHAVTEVDSALTAGNVKLAFSEYAPADWTVYLAGADGDGSFSALSLPLAELDRQKKYDATTVLFVPRVPFEKRVRHGYDDVMNVVRRLRAPNGCPWDREQTHESLKMSLMEECYELLDAIDEADEAHICEELGDVLLQFALHAAISEEQRAFTERDACTQLVDKLVYRHPHVFSDVHVSGADEVLKNWDALKKAERHEQTQTEVMRSIPRSFPALVRSRKVQKKAAAVGFDWASAEEAFPKIAEETEELHLAMQTNGNIEEEAGDLLFAVVNVIRLLHLEPEFLLAQATDKFIARFEQMEREASKKGITLDNMSFAEMDALWESVKKSPNRQ